MKKQSKANRDARNSIRKKSQLAPGVYYFAYEELSWSLYVGDAGEALLSTAYKGDEEDLGASFDVNDDEHTEHVRDSALNSGNNTLVTLEQLQQMLNSVGIQYDLKADFDEAKSDYDNQS